MESRRHSKERRGGSGAIKLCPMSPLRNRSARASPSSSAPLASGSHSPHGQPAPTFFPFCISVRYHMLVQDQGPLQSTTDNHIPPLPIVRRRRSLSFRKKNPSSIRLLSAVNRRDKRASNPSSLQHPRPRRPFSVLERACDVVKVGRYRCSLVDGVALALVSF